ncbi:MAG: aminoglycoside phosphotransferase family protein [bacterium]|nr:aminoglycoside phosphotransferase family protein [bacterium]
MARVEESERAGVAFRQVKVARVWASRGAPVVPLVRSELQPFIFPGGAVTLWQRLHSCSPVDLEKLGRTTRELHETTRGSSFAGLPRHDPFIDTHRSIDWPADWLANKDRAELKELVDLLEERWQNEAADDPLGTVIVHGDVHGGNAIATDRGLFLVDLEDAGVGSASWDLVPLAVGVSRYGDAEADLERFIRGFGDDPRGWTNFKLMCEIYELAVTSWTVRCSEISSAMASEAAVRVNGLLGRSNVEWSMS